MQIVGVDFGTTNVRIATWDTGEPERPPEPQAIGPVDSFAMPSVIAFQRQRDGKITTVVGQDADELEDGRDVVVVRNIKRWALSSDHFVCWHLESAHTPRPEWWNSQTRCIEVWGQEFPVREAIRLILAEAFRRANVTGEFEWRAGCPVHASLEYRSELAGVLSEFGGVNSVTSVIEEPVLFLALAQRRGALGPGSYLVYDLGGGSFDCALAEVEEDGQVTVYAAHGHPLLGGVRIDELLRERLGYEGPSYLLRSAKERLNSSGPAEPVDTRTNLSWEDLKGVVDSRFLDGSVVAMREAYITAKVIWQREEGASPIGEIPSLRWGDVPQALSSNLDGILLTGGPTRSPLIQEWLADRFGDQKVKPAAESLPVEIPDRELTALSMGACYAAAGEYNPLYISRLPARIILRETRSRNEVEYEPYRHFVSNFNPARPFISKPLVPERNADAKYELNILDPDGKRLSRQSVDISRMNLGRSTGGLPRLLPTRESSGNDSEVSYRLCIDNLGRVLILANGRFLVVMENPPWQTKRQNAIIGSILDGQRQYEAEQRERVHHLITYNPYGWQSGHG